MDSLSSNPGISLPRQRRSIAARGSSPRLLSVSPPDWPPHSMAARSQPRRLPASPELQQIVCGAEHLPLAVTGNLPSSQKPVTAPGTLDLSEHRLHGLAA